jgi:RNA polymerase sigma-70 factor (sigma-E family)
MKPLGEADHFCRDQWPRLAASLGFYCYDRAVGEELAQEALARAWARWSHVAAMESPEAWVYSVALNLARSQFRRSRAERRALARSTVLSSAGDTNPTDAIAVRQAVAELPERQRAAVVLRYFADLPVATVAEILDCAQGTVKSLTSQGIDRLRETFGVEELSGEWR